MLLGASSQALDAPADETVVMGDAATDGGVEAGVELVAFAAAAYTMGSELEAARDDLVALLGYPAMLDAAVTAAIFRSLNIAADTSGIRVDDSWESVARLQMESLGTGRFRTADNNPWATEAS